MDTDRQKRAEEYRNAMVGTAKEKEDGPLVWSEAKPLHPGYYWLKYKQGCKTPRVVHVVANPHGKLWADIGGRWDNTMIDSRMFNGGLWAGPIPLPNR